MDNFIDFFSTGFNNFFHNETLLLSMLAFFIAQVGKVVVNFFINKKFEWSRAINNGGMPSSHAAGVMCLSTCVGITEGADSISFAISMIFAMIIMHDASSVRREAGKHATILNQMMTDFHEAFKSGFKGKPLKTLLGHSKLQVFVGAVLGIFIGGLGMYLIRKYS